MPLIAGLILCSCTSQKKTSAYPDDFITSEIIVTLKAEAKADELILSIKKPAFQVKQRLSARMGIFLLVYDDRKYDPGKALIKLQKHSSVKSAEFNKKVSIRDQN